jgi:hypothetical protein
MIVSRILRVLVAAVLAVPVVAFPACSAPPPRGVATLATTRLVVHTADGKAHSFVVEVAATPDAQARGLMFRRKLAAGAGMLFPFSPPRQAHFWMQNTYLPLDMIFIAPGGHIESILANVAPETTTTRSSLGPVAAVLELNAGTAARIGASPGDRVEYRIGQ